MSFCNSNTNLIYSNYVFMKSNIHDFLRIGIKPYVTFVVDILQIL